MLVRGSFLFLFIVSWSVAFSQPFSDSLQKILPDTLQPRLSDTSALQKPVAVKNYQQLLREVLDENKYLELKEKSVSMISAERGHIGKEFFFYFIVGLMLFLGIYKTVYGKYFNNIFRVFFNTSLRQNQLTDILRQSRLPSLVLNIFFTVIAGFYLWLVFYHYNIINDTSNKNVLFFNILLITLVFSLKFCVLKFTGWVTGMSSAIDVYIFIIFLINKVIGLFLIPVVILLAFSSLPSVQGISMFSFLIIGFLFLLQFFRSYGLLQTQLKINWFHFLIYIVAFEVVPYLIIFKWATTSFLTGL